MALFGIIGVIVIIYHFFEAVSEKKLSADYHNNWTLEMQDMNKVTQGQMTQKQFERNLNSGKYR